MFSLVQMVQPWDISCPHPIHRYRMVWHDMNAPALGDVDGILEIVVFSVVRVVRVVRVEQRQVLAENLTLCVSTL